MGQHKNLSILLENLKLSVEEYKKMIKEWSKMTNMERKVYLESKWGLCEFKMIISDDFNKVIQMLNE